MTGQRGRGRGLGQAPDAEGPVAGAGRPRLAAAGIPSRGWTSGFGLRRLFGVRYVRLSQGRILICVCWHACCRSAKGALLLTTLSCAGGDGATGDDTSIPADDSGTASPAVAPEGGQYTLDLMGDWAGDCTDRWWPDGDAEGVEVVISSEGSEVSICALQCALDSLRFGCHYDADTDFAAAGYEALATIEYDLDGAWLTSRHFEADALYRVTCVGSECDEAMAANGGLAPCSGTARFLGDRE